MLGKNKKNTEVEPIDENELEITQYDDTEDDAYDEEGGSNSTEGSLRTITSNEGVYEGKIPKEGTVVLKKNGDILGRAVYHKKPGLFGSFKTPDIEYIPPTKKRLYLLSEVVKMGMVQYLHNNKIEVIQLSDDVSEMLSAAMFETHPARLVILDYGRGDFLEATKIVEIIGLIETFADVGEITVFSNTATFKTAIAKKFAKHKSVLDKVDMHDYKGAVHIYEVLRDKNEIFTEGGAIDISPEDTFEFKGEKVEADPALKQLSDSMTDVRKSLIGAMPEFVTDSEASDMENSVPVFN